MLKFINTSLIGILVGLLGVAVAAVPTYYSFRNDFQIKFNTRE